MQNIIFFPLEFINEYDSKWFKHSIKWLTGLNQTVYSSLQFIWQVRVFFSNHTSQFNISINLQNVQKSAYKLPLSKHLSQSLCLLSIEGTGGDRNQLICTIFARLALAKSHQLWDDQLRITTHKKKKLYCRLFHLRHFNVESKMWTSS